VKTVGQGVVGGYLTNEQVSRVTSEGLAALPVDGRRVIVLVPDGTRTMPLPLMVDILSRELGPRVTALDFLIALGTHSPMNDEQLTALLGRPVEGGRTGPHRVYNHRWDDPSTFASLGTIPASEIADLTGGRLQQDVPVALNRLVIEYDHVLVCGPVFPHEVVGFSGGNKYLFPGVSGQQVIDLSHWLGALITSAAIIGTRGVSPVRALIDEAASMVPSERLALCVVTQTKGDALHSAAFGDPQAAWAAAADVAAQTHVQYLDAPVRRVLSLVPAKYEDMWTGAKGFYKVEPVVADGGQVVLYAPHIREVSTMHPQIAEIGYHCRDYFVKQWDRFKDHPWGDLAHSTHLRGAGTYDEVDGERLRVTVTLATGIPEDQVRAINLDYLDPAEVDPATWVADADTLVVPRAGEVLYRLR
jgi:nickel-dependent lactate racemase